MARKKGFVSMMALAIGAAALVGSGLPVAAKGAGPGGWQGAAPGAQARGAMLFDRMDADGSGTISLEEFTAQSRARFAGLDTDGDGALSATEAEALGPANRPAAGAWGRDDGPKGRHGERLGQSWRRSDNLRGARGHGGFGDPNLADEARAARAQALVAMLDADDDGKLSREEIASRPGPQMMFGRADTDDDGAISRDEVEAAIERFGVRHGNR